MIDTMAINICLCTIAAAADTFHHGTTAHEQPATEEPARYRNPTKLQPLRLLLSYLVTTEFTLCCLLNLSWRAGSQYAALCVRAETHMYAHVHTHIHTNTEAHISTHTYQHTQAHTCTGMYSIHVLLLRV